MSEIPRIITADCSFPKEIDDGLFVEKLDENYELYRVGVCIADTSKLHSDQDVVREAFAKTEARYWDLPGGERGYDPMIDTDLIKNLEFLNGTVRNALIVRFLVGQKQPPSELDVTFDEVEVVKNKNYKEFHKYTVHANEGKKFYRASRLIRDHLRYVAYGDHVGDYPEYSTKETGDDLSGNAWRRGSKCNEAFMVATNHLVGKQLAEEGWPAIYRVHDPEDEQFLDFLSTSAARFSRTPGPHSNLRLDPYCRVTSPLRRLDDFVMNHQLKQRFLGKVPTLSDAESVGRAIRRLNQQIVEKSPSDRSKLSRKDILGKAAGGHVVIAAAS